MQLELAILQQMAVFTVRENAIPVKDDGNGEWRGFPALLIFIGLVKRPITLHPVKPENRFRKGFSHAYSFLKYLMIN
jgi:hypothetical protein